MYKWNLVKIIYNKIDESTGKDVKVKEQYFIDAVSFTEAEARAYKILEEEIGCEFVIDEIDDHSSKIHDVFFTDGEWWFKARVEFTDADPSNGRDKKTKVWNFVQADSLKDAIEKLEKEFSDVLIPWEILSVTKKPEIVDFFPYNAEEISEKEAEGLVPIAEYENKAAVEDLEEEVYNADEEEEEE